MIFFFKLLFVILMEMVSLVLSAILVLFSAGGSIQAGSWVGILQQQQMAGRTD